MKSPGIGEFYVFPIKIVAESAKTTGIGGSVPDEIINAADKVGEFISDNPVTNTIKDGVDIYVEGVSSVANFVDDITPSFIKKIF